MPAIAVASGWWKRDAESRSSWYRSTAAQGLLVRVNGKIDGELAVRVENGYITGAYHVRNPESSRGWSGRPPSAVEAARRQPAAHGDHTRPLSWLALRAGRRRWPASARCLCAAPIAWKVGGVTVHAVEEFERHRSKLFGLAYRMLGSAEEAEDVVQDTFLRWHRAYVVEFPWAWLAKVATNLCVNRLTSARARRESYVGSWLPEPVLTADGTLGPLDTAERRDMVSLAFLVLLERLNPVERAVFVLREAFDYSHREVAEVINSSEVNSRQLYRRARRRLVEAVGDVEHRVDRVSRRDLVERFLAAAERGDLPGLEKLLAEDVTVWVDGGGRIGAARRPISGAHRVARYLVGALNTTGQRVRLSVAELNGAPGLLALAGEELIGVLVPETAGGWISEIRIIASPDKLRLSRSQGLPGSTRMI